ncbi:UNVERIFIED_CONTAM: hypothetical protein GTU68_018887 [Idotea baltica]|nr:hypothetical protein [Idotea baltica]
MLDVTLSHRFEGFDLDVAFQAPSGITAIYGPSGSGKSTIVKSLAGLLRPEKGRISLGDRVLFDTDRKLSLPMSKRRIGVVFQEGRLFPHMGVEQNLTYGQKHKTGARSADLRQIIDLLGIDHLLARRPATLSGGEAQRVAIGRALLSAPDLLLMDEPLASLDAGRKAEILPYLERLRNTIGLPIVYISHSLEEVARLSTTLILLEDGKVVRAGSTKELLGDPELVSYLGEDQAGGFIEGIVVGKNQDDGLVTLKTGGGSLYVPNVMAQPGTTLRVRISMHNVTLFTEDVPRSSALNMLQGQVEHIGPLSDHEMIVVLGIGSDRLLAKVTQRAVQSLNLGQGSRCHAIVGSVKVD